MSTSNERVKGASAGPSVRLDEWCCSYYGPSETPGVSKLHAGVFRGMRDEEAALEYANKVAAFFGSLGLSKPVFVVAGPTSTTRCPFEVVDACAGYVVLHRLMSQPADVEVAGEHDASDFERPRG